MARLVVNYDVLSDIASRASKISRKADAYADDLTNKVLNKFGNIEGGASTYTSDAKYYVNAKIKSLREKQNSYSELSKNITEFSEKARRVDEAVEKMLARNQEKFLDRHEHLRIDEWKANLLNWLVDLKNSCPLFELVGNALRNIETALSDMFANIKYWYECEGGKEIVKFVAAIGGAILAVVLFVASLPASGFIAICAAIGAAIGVINAITNVVTSFKAMRAAQNGDPAWARIYGNQDKLSDVLRQTNFDNAFLNKLSYVGAAVIDAVELFCDLVGFVDLGKKVINKVKAMPHNPNPITNYFGKDTGLMSYMKEAEYHEVIDYDNWGNPCGKKWALKVDEYGVVQTRFTPKSIWRGVKAFVMDSPIDCRSEKGIRTLLGENFSIDFKDWRKSFSIQGFKDTFKYEVTDGGRVTYADWKNSFSFQGFKDTIRYNLKNNSVTGMFAEGMTWDQRKDYAKTAVKTVKNVYKYGNAAVNGELGNLLWEDNKSFLKGRSHNYQLYEGLRKPASKIFDKWNIFRENYGKPFGAMLGS